MPEQFRSYDGSVHADPLPESLRVGEVVSALSQALDLGVGSSIWHSVRTCILGMRIAVEVELPEDIQNHLYYALLLKDAGCHDARSRAGQGGTLARLIGLAQDTARGIAPDESIPTIPRIILLAQTLDKERTLAGSHVALSNAIQKGGSWFDPSLVKAACSLASRAALWSDLDDPNPLALVLSLEPRPRTVAEGDVTLEAVCQAFASIVDAKSPFTYQHSNGVANVAASIASKLELHRSRISLVRYAALLHDLGKMAVSNSILQKAGELNPIEWRIMRSHPEHTWRILRSIRGFERLSEVAASHHEKLDGTGYFRGLSAPQLPIESRILAIADVFDALSTKRPYRDALPPERAFALIRENTPSAFDPDCVEALEQCDLNADRTFRDILALQQHLGSTDNCLVSAQALAR